MANTISGAFGRLGRTQNRRRSGLMNGAGRAGPRRLALILLLILLTVIAITVAMTSGRHAPPVSQDARLKHVDALPGGMNSSPEQEALALTANDVQARKALEQGASFTPPMAPSTPATPPPPQVEQPIPQADTPAPGGATAHRVPVVSHFPRPPRRLVPEPLLQTVTFPAPVDMASPAQHLHAIPVAATVDPQAEKGYSDQIHNLFSQWHGQLPRTDVVEPIAEQNSGDPSDAGSNTAAALDHGHDEATSSNALPRSGTVMIPAGRGVYAHPVLALSSDQSSPVVMQADSGPIAGDRMIGSFAKENDRLIIHINSVIHNGQPVSVDGVVTAPDTMEASVASGVDEHYASRFLLPAAAAFVAGLGQAIEQTSNSTAVLSPLGGATTSTHLNIDQQLGVAAGSAASQIGSVLNQEAPKSATVTLDANVAVGVMFLSNVTSHDAP